MRICFIAEITTCENASNDIWKNKTIVFEGWGQTTSYISKLLGIDKAGLLAIEPFYDLIPKPEGMYFDNDTAKVRLTVATLRKD
tara:strand:+ start:1507 stop:1758 length:252 start_codon:yes stop_codon:yes gene_type:complete